MGGVEQLKRGDFVRATYAGKTVDAMVTLVSPNGKSVFIMFDAMLGGHVGAMPISQEDDGTYVSVLEQLPIAIERLRR